ncbi:MAG: DUF3160 domain-containing protein [Verrucomicrobiaceae bacterium]|nr:DUF3160 domain-containing protein [Verrucomicrobiaceae bacterium]
MASHQTLQAQEPIFWETNIYQGWLGALNHFRFVASLMEMLREITERELNEKSMTEEPAHFMKGLVESMSVDYVSSPTYSGWYPDLYYPSILLQMGTNDHPSVIWNAIVADVHSDSPAFECHGNPGGVIHEVVGNVDFMMFAVSHGAEGCVFAGPVFR